MAYTTSLLEARLNEFLDRAPSDNAHARVQTPTAKWLWTPPRRKGVMLVDIECYRNFFYIGFKRKSDGRRLGFEFSERSPEPNWAQIRNLLNKYTIVTFNGKSYDIPMIHLALAGATNDELKEASDKIIKGGIKWWDVEEELGIRVSKNIDHIDLFEPNPSVKDSLKTLNGRLHGKRMQDLPYHESTVLTHKQMDKTADYCLHSDLDATDNLLDQLKEALDLRIDLSRIYGVDMRSKSDAQIGETFVKIRYQQMTGKQPKKLDKKVISFKYKVPDFIQFNSPMMQEVLDTIRDTTIHVNPAKGKVELPKAWEKFNINFSGMRFTLGIGGLHSTEKNRAVVSNDEYVLIDADVASQYPSIIMKLGLYPKALGPEFLTIYNGAIISRLEAKAEAKRLKPLAEEWEKEHPGRRDSPMHEQLRMLAVQDKGGKIQLNGIYGKLGSPYSIVFAPHLLISTTLTGQLTLLMLIEAAEENGIEIVSANTDGVIFKCPRKLYNGMGGVDGTQKDRLAPSFLQKLTAWWEETTSFKLEFAEYKAIYNASVNEYIAIDSKGKAKRKGTLANHWSPESPDYSPTYEMMKKNPQMTVCADAALDHILHGTDIKSYIKNYKDIRGFVTVVNATGGGKWRDEYLGKVVRYIWSTDGDPILKVVANDQGTHAKVMKTDGCRPLMTLPDEFPDDIDYDHYIKETEQILEDIRFKEPRKVYKPLRAGKAGSRRYYSLMRSMVA